jgi:RNA polymerase sigma-70 factor (ECF subfamily)
VRKFVRNPEIAKDLTQEIFIKAYLNYDYYTETGKIRAWLSVIAHNKLKDYYKVEQYRNTQVEFLPLDDYASVQSQSHAQSRDESPEHIAEQKDFTNQVIRIINTLPKKQRDAVFYSVIHSYTEKEIAIMQNIPVGSVKSAKHYGLEKVKKLMSENNLINDDFNNDLIGKVKNNMNKFNSKEAYTFLYQYAKSHISSENKAAVEEYIKTDEESRNIAEALKELHGKLNFPDYMTGHYNIVFALKSGDVVTYSNIGSVMNKADCEKANAYLEANGGNTPPDEKWFDHGGDGKPKTTPSFDNEGNLMEFIGNYNENDNHTRYHCTKMKKLYFPFHWQYSVYYRTDNNAYPGNVFSKLDIAPNLYHARIGNHFGGEVKSALYLALPENAENIVMKRGNGVLECGKYKFLYADRYLAADEGIFAECTFNLSE